MSLAWRFAALGGLCAGLLASPFTGGTDGGGTLPALIGAALAAVALAAGPRPRAPAGRVAWLAALAGAMAIAGLAAGSLRLHAIDAGAFTAEPGSGVRVRGLVAAVPRRSRGEVSVRVDAGGGRLLVTAPEPVPDLPIGSEVVAGGVLRAPEEWQAGYLRRLGIAMVVEARSISLTGERRGGVGGLVDGVRTRAEAALERGTPQAEASLLRGFVLGEDDRIGPATVTDFQRSGLAHLLAVSGQNVVLLALLAQPVLALLGVPLRARLWCLLGLIAIYVPLTGAGPSIQRAGVMGAAGVVAAFAGRPASRWYSMLLAAALTLALNPRASGDAGWQLSFAAVAGIALWTRPLRDVLLPARADSAGTAAALADGAAVTVSATLATAPLMAHHFGAVSVASLPANLLALPAVAPVMWLGMIVAALGQVPALPLEPLTGFAGLLAAYVSQVAHWFAAPTWAQLDLPLPSALDVALAYLLAASLLGVALRSARRRRGLGSPRRVALTAGLVATAVAAGLLAATGSPPPPPANPGLRVTVLDVGQGDAIALQPADGGAVLVDGGPPGDGIVSMLGDLGIGGLAGAVVTHDQADHAGGIEDLLGELPVRRFVFARAGPRLRTEARSAGARLTPVAEGSEIDSGSLRLEVLWPPRALLAGPRPADANEQAIVLLARWGRFGLLLTADAEAESVPLDPGPVDVLKVAHHGSEDPGLGRLLDRARPRLAVISVGAGNPYGHPAAATLQELAAHGVPVMRTDLEGSVTIEVGPAGWTLD